MTLKEARAIVNRLVNEVYHTPSLKKWEVQLGRNPWFSLGIHVDHGDPSVTFHFPGILICVGNCQQPGFKFWNQIVPKAIVESDNDS